MKFSIFFILFFGQFLSNVLAQTPCSLPIDKETGNVAYEQIFLADGLTKEQIHSKVVEWFTIVANSANNTIQLNDIENGKFIAKFNYQLNSAGGMMLKRAGEVWCMIHVTSKDGKYKFYISGFRHTFSYNARNYDCGTIESVISAGCKCKNGTGAPDAYAKAFAQGIKDGAKDFSVSLHNFITAQSGKNDDF
jgi:hypothetical protein